MPQFFVIEEVLYHVRSNDAAENVHNRRQQGFERLANRRCSVPPDNGPDIQMNAMAIDPAQVLQQRVLGLRARQRPSQQRHVSFVSNGASQTLRHLPIGTLHRRANRRLLDRASCLSFEQLASDLARFRGSLNRHADVGL